jgi:tripartite-type tricarboxylate transporter receptor subunit TctC
MRSKDKSKAIGLCAAFAFGVTAASMPSKGSADPVADFYRGKTVTLVVGFDAGGGYDTAARILIRHLPRHIPGNPNVIVSNMSGAGSMVALNYAYNAAVKDGTVMAMFSATIVLEPMLGNKKAQFDASKFGYIGNIHTDINSCGVWKSTGIKTFDELLKSKKTVVFGALSPENVTSRYPVFFKKVFNAPVKVVNGYKGTNAINLAMQKGEADATCGMYESTILGPFRQYVDSGDLKIIFQTAFEEKVKTFGDAASIGELVAGKGEELRQIAELVYRPTEVTRPIVAPPGVPAERLAALKKAFDATMKDPDMLADGRRISVDFKPMSGDRVAEIFGGFLKSPPEVVKKAQEASVE